MSAGSGTVPLVRPVVSPVEWRDGTLRVMDQTLLPAEERYLDVVDAEGLASAIARLAVRGAPLLGVAAGYGMALEAVRSTASTPVDLVRDLERAARTLEASRPTAVNLGWAVRRVLTAARRAAEGSSGSEAVAAARRAAVDEAGAIAREDARACDAIARFGAGLVRDGSNVLTHCNTGALATGGCGTALGVIAAAHRDGKRIHVWVDETRPLLQGARLTAWELQRLGVPMTLVADVAAGSLMARGLVDLVVVGADRIAANGDVANKIGTYPLAVLAGRHGIPFVVAAPTSTVDGATPAGDRIVVEDRDPNEVLAPQGVPFAPDGVRAANPAFDVTPASLITAIVTDHGVARSPLDAALRELSSAGGPA
jgi:methylthioribose-1-phosphate isomerase